MKILIYGWNEGFNKVSFNQFLRKEYGYSIREAKIIVDDILDEKKVYLNDIELENIDTIFSNLKYKKTVG